MYRFLNYVMYCTYLVGEGISVGVTTNIPAVVSKFYKKLGRGSSVLRGSSEVDSPQKCAHRKFVSVKK